MTARVNVAGLVLAVVMTGFLEGWADQTRGETLDVLPGYKDLPVAQDMMKNYLFRHIQQAQAEWLAAYEGRKTPEQIDAYQKRLKSEFIARIGGFPPRTPLNARVVGVLKRDGYRVEKILFESQPKHFVTAALFLPDSKRFEPPYPGVAMACGHSDDGKANVGYATYCALAATNGLATLIFDPIDQGERHQWIDKDGKTSLTCCPGHNMVGVGSILLGRNTARFEIFDGIRAIDYTSRGHILRFLECLKTQCEQRVERGLVVRMCSGQAMRDGR